MALNVHRNYKAYQGRGEEGVRGYGFHSLKYPNLSESVDSVGEQLRRDKECPFSGVLNSGRVWRKASESEARSMDLRVAKSGLSPIVSG